MMIMKWRRGLWLEKRSNDVAGDILSGGFCLAVIGDKLAGFAHPKSV